MIFNLAELSTGWLLTAVAELTVNLAELTVNLAELTVNLAELCTWILLT